MAKLHIGVKSMREAICWCMAHFTLKSASIEIEIAPQTRPFWPRFLFPETPMFGEGSDRRQSKLRGEWVELLFMARAAEHGLRVMRPGRQQPV
jgi:hypothetical protein